MCFTSNSFFKFREYNNSCDLKVNLHDLGIACDIFFRNYRLIFPYFKIGLFLSPLMRTLRLVLRMSEIMALWSWAYISFRTYFKCYIKKSLSCFALVQRLIGCYSLLKGLYCIITWQQYFNDTTCLWSAPHTPYTGGWVHE